MDLNSLLYALEQALARCYRQAGQPTRRQLDAHASERRLAMHRYLWDAKQGVYDDYAWRERRLTGHLSAATLYPLFAGVATTRAGPRIAAAVRDRLLRTGDSSGRTAHTGEQWDAPNGWAPLQWIAVEGLRLHGQG